MDAPQARQQAIAHDKWSCATMEPPRFDWKPKGTYVCFLSHYKMEAASDCRRATPVKGRKGI